MCRTKKNNWRAKVKVQKTDVQNKNTQEEQKLKYRVYRCVEQEQTRRAKVKVQSTDVQNKNTQEEKKLKYIV